MKLFLLTFFVAAAVALPVPDDEASGPIDVIVNGVPEGHALEIGHLLDVHVQEKVDGETVKAADVLQPYTVEAVVAAAEAAAAEAAAAEAAAAAAAAAEAAAIAAEESQQVSPVSPVVVVETNDEPSIVLPVPALPTVIETPEAVEQKPEIALPEPVVLPSPSTPEVTEAEILPVVVVESSPEAVEGTPVNVIDSETPVAVNPTLVAPETPEVPQTHEVTEVAEVLPAPAAQGEVFNDGIVQIAVNPSQPTLLNHISNWFNFVVNYVTGKTE